MYHNSSVWLDAWNWDRNPPNFTLDLVSDRSANKLGNYTVLSSSVRLFTFYTLPDTRVLNSFEELCIMRATVVNSFTRVLNPNGGSVYIVIHRQTVSLYHNIYIYIYIYIWKNCVICRNYDLLTCNSQTQIYKWIKSSNHLKLLIEYWLDSEMSIILSALEHLFFILINAFFNIFIVTWKINMIPDFKVSMNLFNPSSRVGRETKSIFSKV